MFLNREEATQLVRMGPSAWHVDEQTVAERLAPPAGPPRGHGVHDAVPKPPGGRAISAGALRPAVADLCYYLPSADGLQDRNRPQKRRDEYMGKTVMGAVVSLDGFIADDHDNVGPLFDWLGNGDVAWSFPGSDGESRTSQASADFMLDLYGDMAANVIGRRVFDMTNGWNGKPAAGEHVFVVTHRPPTDWKYADTAPFTFVDGVENAITAAKVFAGDRVVDVAAGQIGGQALKLGLIDQVVVNQVPVVFGSGRPFFATGGLAKPLRLENPTTIVRGDRVTHLVYDVSH
jgi:dihydrofolate reductase